MEKAVLMEVVDSIATITLNRPKALNSMNELLVKELHNVLDTVERTNEIKVAVLTGNGKAFSAGGDLSYIETLKTTKERKEFIVEVGELAQKIQNMSKPVIAMVNGVTAGAGVNLMLACDLIYVVDNAKFAQSFAKVGLVPDCGGMYLLSKAIGVHKAKELMFTAKMIDAKTAKEFGMINHICAKDELVAETFKMAKELSHAAPLSLEFIKKTLNNTKLTLTDILDIESSLQPLCLASNDCQEGINAFKEKREAKFTGE